MVSTLLCLHIAAMKTNKTFQLAIWPKVGDSPKKNLYSWWQKILICGSFQSLKAKGHSLLCFHISSIIYKNISLSLSTILTPFQKKKIWRRKIWKKKRTREIFSGKKMRKWLFASILKINILQIYSSTRFYFNSFSLSSLSTFIHTLSSAFDLISFLVKTSNSCFCGILHETYAHQFLFKHLLQSWPPPWIQQ